MKKKQTVKLSLNKKTIANLNREHMNSIVGGNDEGNESAGIIDTDPCDNQLSGPIPQNCRINPPNSDLCNDNTNVNCTH